MKRVIFFSAVLSLFMRAGMASADAICADLSGAAWGLCHAYCEAMECDTENPNAAEHACMVVGARFERITGDRPPCECDLPGRIYTLHDPAVCLLIEWACPPGYVRFLDTCGCGCDPLE
jgi:hypothetical protein